MSGRAPSLRTIALRALSGEAGVPRGSTLLAAVSGGPDSMALLDVLARSARGLGITVVAHGVDHGLRAEAARELDLAEGLAAALGIAFARTRVTIARGGNLQARARAARWAALVTAARAAGAGVIATAHHADDRAETLLIRLLRGSGMRGLAVMPPRAPSPLAGDVTVVRPLLRARKADVLAHLARRKIGYARDPSNEDPRFLRTRIRCELSPLLEQLSPNVVAHLAALADELIEASAEEGRGAAARPDEPLAVRSDWTAALPRRTQEAIRTLVRSGSTSARVWLPGGLVVSLDGRARRPRSPQSKA